MKLNHFSKGDSSHPAVILVHGLLGASRNLHRLAEAIAKEGYFVTAYDQRGHGHSDHGEVSSYNLEQLAQDLFEVMDTVNVAQAHLVGHSMGGRVCLAAAAKKPERVVTLSMLDVGVGIHAPAFAEIKTIVESLSESGYASKDEAKLSFSAFGKDMEAFLISNLRTENGRLKWVFDLSGIRSSLLKNIPRDQTELFKNLRCPVLLVRGEDSKHFTQNELEEMLNLNLAAEAAIVSHAGHWIHADNFDGTLTAILRFLKKH